MVIDRVWGGSGGQSTLTDLQQKSLSSNMKYTLGRGGSGGVVGGCGHLYRQTPPMHLFSGLWTEYILVHGYSSSLQSADTDDRTQVSL